ncbi:hypothetical protein [Lonomia obliqua multiple nucleopolyhedrovirus]|uniref:Uncharacterized protein n=1 Tax=Lonomia obliqua multiple nucleopolyhedrovirus TaxID=134394 RepID=A0A126FCF0_9ABAC|nr:hypothetical protein [Lonomia obliqua multiple nucleopolyhedrovirus]AKN81076.1 hypothetical protein [Lonomia obliqua multiple nucleopolyhedrovirus]
MDLMLKLIPINLKGEEEQEQIVNITPTIFNGRYTEICYNIKCRSPFAKFKVLIIINNFTEKYIQATFCNDRDNVSIVNGHEQRQIIFDGFVALDDEGSTVPFVIGPLFSVQSSERDMTTNVKVRDIVNKISNKQTMLKVFFNEANVFNTRKNKVNNFIDLLFKGLKQESSLIDNVVKFNTNLNINSDAVIFRKSNLTRWVPALNYCTGKSY